MRPSVRAQNNVSANIRSAADRAFPAGPGVSWMMVTTDGTEQSCGWTLTPIHAATMRSAVHNDSCGTRDL
jgi:hypothetical protein